MISQDIEREYLKKQLEEVEKDIETIKEDIKNAEVFTKRKELKLEQKQNLKISLEKRLNNLNVNDNSLSSYLNNERVTNLDNAFIENQESINANNEQIRLYNEQIENSKGILKKADLLIQRKKLEIQNGFLNKKSAFIKNNQRMYIAANRLVAERENKAENLKVSVNAINLRKMQEKYEAKVERTHELNEYQNQLKADGHKIRSNILGKVVNFYNKKDDKTRMKLQKLINTKSELLKIESARQFYDNYYLTINQSKVLSGDRLTHYDITETVFQDVDGNLYAKKADGQVSLVPPELWAEVAEKHGIDIGGETKSKVA